jgi:hypothetical protein
MSGARAGHEGFVLWETPLNRTGTPLRASPFFTFVILLTGVVV